MSAGKTYKISKGKHRPWPPNQLTIWIDKGTIAKRIIFSDSCRYNLPGTADDTDINKLFGIGYLWGGHHTSSARFGWMYDNEIDQIVLFSYCYVEGKRVYESICSVPIGVAFNLYIFIHYNYYSFSVVRLFDKKIIGSKVVEKKHHKKIGYPLGLYFGGQNDATGKDNTAPHDMLFRMYKIKS